MQVSATTEAPGATDADTVAIGSFEDEEPAGEVPAAVSELLATGEASGAFKALALAHADGKRWLSVGLGARGDFTAESARVAASVARGRARELSTRALCWQAPADTAPEVAGALVEGTILADYSFERYKSAPSGDGSGEEKPKHLQRLIISAPQERAAIVAYSAIVAEAANAARELQNRPANDLTPSALAQHATALAGQLQGLTVEVEGRDGIRARKMGAFSAVAQGSDQEPALITLRYDGPAADSAPVLGFVGKAVTFDSGGISLKPGAKMAEMKFDMSGGAAVIEAIGAIARLRLPVRLRGVVGATENLPSGHSVKPGDIVTAANGKTIEVNNTDAEGRLVLADCLCHVAGEGAERIVDVATLTGAVIVALGSTYAGLLSKDDELVKGTYADLDNAPEARKAGTIVGAAFLSNFVGEVPWAHLDIAGSAWDLGRPYVGKGASGFGVRLLVELARSYCPQPA